MKFLNRTTFFQSSVFFGGLILVTVAFQFFISNKLENKAIEIHAFASFISEVNTGIEAIDIKSTERGVEISNRAEHSQFIARFQKFLDEYSIEHNGEKLEISKNLMESIDPQKDTEKPLKEILAELAYRLKMNNSSIKTTIRQLINRLSQLEDELQQRLESIHFYQKLTVYLLFILLTAELLAAILFLKANLFNPLKKGHQYCASFAVGKANDTRLPNRNAELGHLFDRLNQANETISHTDRYLNELLKGNSDINFDKGQTENELVKKLEALTTQIQKTKLEEEQANWMNVGLAKFGEILQSHNDDMEKFGDQLISELVKYVGANQGAIFTIEGTNTDQHLRLRSTYAWGKKRFLERQVPMDGGNLMAQAIKEGEHIYLKEIPDHFINITSGLGDATPTALLIVPLMVNNEPLGVIEIAAFKDFENLKIDFIRKVCENISTTFSAIAHAVNTRMLLEQSQTMTEQLRAQEEELRQNAEELEASRENIHRELEIAKKEMQGQVEQIESEKLKNIAILEGCVDGVVIFKEDGIVDFFNKSAEEIWNVSREEVVGHSIEKLLSIELIHDQNRSSIFYTGGGQYKEIDVRTEINTLDQSGNEISLLVTSSQGHVKGANTYAFFVQTITVELF